MPFLSLVQVAGASYSADCAVFEPGAKHTFDEGVGENDDDPVFLGFVTITRASLPSLGKNVANPTAMLLSTAKMLDHVNLPHHAKTVKTAVEKVLKAGKVRTRDLGGYATTRQFTEEVIKHT